MCVMGMYCITDEAITAPAPSRADTVVLVATGEIDFGAAPHLRERVLASIRAGGRHLLLDFSMVTFIDSTVIIGVLVGAATTLNETGGGSVAVVCREDNERVLRIFDIAGLASMVELHHSREEAFAALARARAFDPSTSATADAAATAPVNAAAGDPVISATGAPGASPAAAAPGACGAPPRRTAVRSYQTDATTQRRGSRDSRRDRSSAHVVDELA
jgi:anti-anti-sigma factor